MTIINNRDNCRKFLNISSECQSRLPCLKLKWNGTIICNKILIVIIVKTKMFIHFFNLNSGYNTKKKYHNHHHLDKDHDPLLLWIVKYLFFHLTLTRFTLFLGVTNIYVVSFFIQLHTKSCNSFSEIKAFYVLFI